MFTNQALQTSSVTETKVTRSYSNVKQRVGHHLCFTGLDETYSSHTFVLVSIKILEFKFVALSQALDQNSDTEDRDVTLIASLVDGGWDNCRAVQSLDIAGGPGNIQSDGRDAEHLGQHLQGVQLKEVA